MGTLRNITHSITQRLLEEKEERIGEAKATFLPTCKHPECINISYSIDGEVKCIRCENAGQTIQFLKKNQVIDFHLWVNDELRLYKKEEIAEGITKDVEVILPEVITDSVALHLAALNELPVKTITSKIIHALRYMAVAI